MNYVPPPSDTPSEPLTTRGQRSERYCPVELRPVTETELFRALDKLVYRHGAKLAGDQNAYSCGITHALIDLMHVARRNQVDFGLVSRDACKTFQEEMNRQDPGADRNGA